MDFIYHTDSGHGWVETEKAFLKQLNIDTLITGWSYEYGDKAYLEEDCDLSLFMHKAKEKGWNVSFKEKHTNHDSPIRNKLRYTKTN